MRKNLPALPKTLALLAAVCFTAGCGTGTEPGQMSNPTTVTTTAKPAAAETEATPEEMFTQFLALHGLFPTEGELLYARLDCMTDGGGVKFRDIVRGWENQGYGPEDAETFVVATFTTLCSWPTAMLPSVPVEYANL